MRRLLLVILLIILFSCTWLQPSYAGSATCVTVDNLATTLGPIKCFFWMCRSTITVVHGTTYYIALVNVTRSAREGDPVNVTGIACNDVVTRVKLTNN